MKIFRYSIQLGTFGGVVLAETQDDAFRKVENKYYNDGYEMSDILVWEFANDDYFDAANPDVIECYGY